MKLIVYSDSIYGNGMWVVLISFEIEMEKHHWHKVYTEKTTAHPASRWGHSCVSIGEEVVFFGGYADSNYMNDVWVFNTVSMAWTEVKTVGEVPSPRSNCSMNYDALNNRVIVFGGGGANKKRFNSINILDWGTREWSEINPEPSEASPAERTYHAAELCYPYLAVFGGEGLADLDDFWVYNFESGRWEEVPRVGHRPCPRRFHSSALVGKEFFVVAGCYGKYRCLSDVHSVDLTPLFQGGSVQDLRWTEFPLDSSSFLTRWGHSSICYDNKIYIFAGRFSSDLNDILVLDLPKKTIKPLKVGVKETPKPRRRHSAVFIGSCMLIFGGFNGEYFNDMHYINVFELKSRLQLPFAQRFSLLNASLLSTHVLHTLDNHPIHVHQGLCNVPHFDAFLRQVDHCYEKTSLLSILTALYEEVGTLPGQLAEKHQIVLYASKMDKMNARKRAFGINESLAKSKSALPVVCLSDSEYECFLQRIRSSAFNDGSLLLNEYEMPVNTARLASASTYFLHLFAKNGRKEVRVPLYTNIVVYEIMLNYLLLEMVVVPKGADEETWTALYTLAEYYCLTRLVTICEAVLVSKAADYNHEQLFLFALDAEADTLALCCAEIEVKTIVFKQDLPELIVKDPFLAKKKEQALNFVYNLIRFDLDQAQIEKDNQVQIKNISQNEKQNNQNVFI